MIKIYVNDRPVSLVTHGRPADITLNGTEDQEMLREIFNEFENNAAPYLTISSPDLNATFEKIDNIYTVLEAAGGIVYNKNGHLLMIYRNSKWDLPKGKIEEGESPETAAQREVAEECGVNNLMLTSPCNITFHTYSFKSEKILKKTYWYRMLTNSEKQLIPQSEEGIEIARWMDEAAVKEALNNTYASIKDLLRNEMT